jgi:CheY-like chemotaxis protein
VSYPGTDLERSRDPVDLMPGRILIVDDERQIHASLRLRLAGDYDLVCCFSGRDALKKLSEERFDLCFADIHMPAMDGLRFIDAARSVDPQLGYVVLSAFDSDSNLRRTIPLQVYDFIPKPLPERHHFEGRIQTWVEATRTRRREHELALQADTVANERDSARMERDVELVASDRARDALQQVAGLLSTINAHYFNACSVLTDRVKGDPTLMPLLRAMEQGRRATEAVVNVTESFIGSAYGSRDSSPALINPGICDAIALATRDPRVLELRKAVHFLQLDVRLPLRGLSGIGFLLMVFPALAAALALASPNTTVSIRGEHHARLDGVLKDPKLRSYYWLNRRNALTSHPAWVIAISSTSSALSRAQVELWLKGEYAPLAAITPRGIIDGIQKAHGLLGFAVSPAEHFRLCLALPA